MSVIQTVPEVTFKTRVRDESVEGPNPFRWEDKTTSDLFAGKKVVVFSLPGAFTPTCSSNHLPRYEELYEEFQAQAFSLLDENGKKYSVTAMMPRGKPVLSELGITLVAVPSVGADLDTISLLLTPTISKLDEFLFYTETESVSNTFQQVAVKLPTISRREVQTKVIVQSGETVVMGGLIESVSTERESTIPILGSIPFLGKLFSRTDAVEERRNLIIFVTATVISERGESLVAGGDTAASPPPETDGTK